MWVPGKIIEFFGLNAEMVRTIQSELAAVRAERDIFKQELTAAKINADWLRLRFNELERENKALLEKAYSIKLPVPELMRRPVVDPTFEQFSFDDMGNEMARKLGLPVYDDK